MKKYRPPQDAIFEELSQFERSNFGSVGFMSENPANESRVSRGIIMSGADVDANASHADIMSVAGAVSSINFNERLGCFEEVVVYDSN